MNENIEFCPLFMGLSFSEIADLLESVGYKEKTYKKGDIIAFSDDECVDMLIITNGSVKGEMVDYMGKTIKIEDIESPRVLAPAFLFGKNNRYPVNIVANNAVELLAIRKNAFVKLLQLNEVVLKNFLNNISNRAQFLTNKIKLLSFQTIKGKIANYLLQLVKKTGSDNLLIPNSQNQLAELFGVTRPSLARAIRELDKDGYIKAEGKKIEVLNKNGLAGLLR